MPESIFGAKVMAECTPTGGGVTGKALPKEGMKHLKEETFKLFLNIRGVLSSLSQHGETARGLWSNAVGAFVGTNYINKH